jgi:hypothetical protein
MDSLAEKIDAVRRANPALNAAGWKFSGFGNKEHEKLRAEMTCAGEVREFERALEFLARCKRRETVYRGVSSYGWNHQAERSFGHPGKNLGYVSNGMFIAAAIAKGFVVERCHDSPNCYLNISAPDGPHKAPSSIRA